LSRRLFFGALGTLLLADPLWSGSWAQAGPTTPVPPFLAGAEITSQLTYSCPSNTACSFVCPVGALGGAGGTGGLGAAGGGGAGGAGGAGGPGPLGGPIQFLGADHVTKLNIYLGTMPFGNGQNAPVLFYEFSTRERPNSSGFSISAGLSASSCQVNGLTLDYSGRPSSEIPSPPTNR